MNWAAAARQFSKRPPPARRQPLTLSEKLQGLVLVTRVDSAALYRAQTPQTGFLSLIFARCRITA